MIPHEFKMEIGQPETWPPMDSWEEQWDDRFGTSGYRLAEMIAARVEYETMIGSAAGYQRADGKLGVFGRDMSDEDVRDYWRLFWTFDGPLYKPIAIEFYDEAGGPAWRVECRKMAYIPDHIRKTIVEAYWAPKDANK